MLHVNVCVTWTSSVKAATAGKLTTDCCQICIIHVTRPSGVTWTVENPNTKRESPWEINRSEGSLAVGSIQQKITTRTHSQSSNIGGRNPKWTKPLMTLNWKKFVRLQLFYVGSNHAKYVGNSQALITWTCWCQWRIQYPTYLACVWPS